MNLIAFVASFIVLVTIIARADDHLTRPLNEGWLPMVRLQVEKIALLLVGVAAGWQMLTVIVGITPSGESVALMGGTALWMLSHPSGWFAYVLTGRKSHDTSLRAPQ